MPAIYLGLFMLLISLFSALSAVYIATWLTRRERLRFGMGKKSTPEPDPAERQLQTAELAYPDGATFPQAAPDLNGASHPDFREILELSPMLTWSTNENGEVIWANRAYLVLTRQAELHAPQNAPHIPVLFDDHGISPVSRRRELTLPEHPDPFWFEQYSFPTGVGGALHFSLHADPVVKAEQALRNFVQTLTKTFAHLPIGLAIFDRDRHLALFNPALSDLTTIEPNWLIARPTLYAFLDRLREQRHVPEPKDYKSWRDRIAVLEKAAQDGTYEEHWPLPTGQTYRVTGRPHPEGAVAFLFEDITSSISLQRQFRSDLELGQSVIDAMDEAIAVFSPLGELVLSNDAFATTWGMDPREMLSVLSIREAVSSWRDSCEPTPVWAEFSVFFEASAQRVGGQGIVCQKNGRHLELRYQPLQAGAIMCRFSVVKTPRQKRRRKTSVPR